MSKRSSTGLGVVFSTALAVVASAAGDEATVYVTVERGGPELYVEASHRELTDSANDLREQFRKRKHLALVDDPDEADIVVAVVDRRVEVARTGQTNYGGGMTQPRYESRYVITYRIRAAGASQEKDYYAAGSFVTWRRVASGLSKSVEKWARRNADALAAWRARRGETPR